MTRFPGCKSSLLWNFNFKLHMHVDDGHRQKPISFSARSLWKWPPGGHIGFFGFQTLTLVWLWISTPNLSGTILMYMCRSLLIFSNVNFKMAARQPYWNFWFPDSNFSLALNINCKLKWHNNYIDMGRSLLIFSDVTFKMAAWRPYWIFWFPDSNFTLALNINSKLQWQSTYVYG